MITGQFSDECRDFEADVEKPDGKPKDISYVELHYADGRVVKDEDVNSPHYEIDEGPGDEKTHVFVKSGTTTERFDCDGNGGEDPECSDGVDNDGDKKTDFPEDPGCDSAEDDSEAPNPECSDGVDNDGDKKVDSDDPECHTDGDPTNPDSYDPRDDDESNGDQPECSDGVDNDGDKKTDFPEDPGCDSAEDDSEAPNPECSDGVDNDGDKKVDSDDPECHTDGDPTNPDSYDPRDDDESNGDQPECSDGVDNDGDKKIDYPDDPGCDSAEDDSEAPNPECSDGVDNDGDGKVDSDDPECHTDGDPTNPDSYDPRDDDESNGGTGDGAFSCRASALRIDGSPLAPVIGDPFEPFVANDAKDPCVDADGSLINTGDDISGPPGTLTVKVLHATTEDDNGADAEAGAANVIVKDETGAEVLRVGVANANATGRCEGGQPVLDGESEIVGLKIGENETTIPQDDPATPEDESFTEIPLGPLGTVFLNWEDDTGDELTRRAVFFQGSPLGDVIVGEAIADFSDNPCA
ncbi:choice-of-anchor P family protein [Haloechinothrix salitolerans]|uniref:Choice-of-anchor P family protein n=1 Tax=Haloechinothrix salitolerans TaxID=926830 RepID=A0ABW2CAM1_9PSEU